MEKPTIEQMIDYVALDEDDNFFTEEDQVISEAIIAILERERDRGDVWIRNEQGELERVYIKPASNE